MTQLKTVVQKQYQALADGAATIAGLRTPPEGWLRTVRKALGMSGAEVARRMGVTRARVAQAERAELAGGATLKSMQFAAEAMGCRFVYAIVPATRIQDLIAAQARRKAETLVATAGIHMALEGQSLSDEQNSREIKRLASELQREMPSDLWTDR